MVSEVAIERFSSHMEVFSRAVNRSSFQTNCTTLALATDLRGSSGYASLTVLRNSLERLSLMA